MRSRAGGIFEGDEGRTRRRGVLPGRDDKRERVEFILVGDYEGGSAKTRGRGQRFAK